MPDAQHDVSDSPPGAAGADRVRGALERVLASSAFGGAQRMQRFLRYGVEHTLLGDGKPLREYSIGVDVFDRDPAFDPRVDPIVRVEARRLRKKLGDYYASEGADEPLRFELPKGGYAVGLIERPAPRAASALGPITAQPDAPGRSAGAHPAPRVLLWFAAAAAMALVAAGLLRLARVTPGGSRPEPQALPARTVRSLAVLPLQNLSGDPAKDYLVDGVTDALVTDLAQLHALRVISRTSAVRYKGTTKSLPQIGQELHVDAIVEGSVVASGNRLRITAQLIDARTDTHLWARAFDGGPQDLLNLQGQVAQAIADGVRVAVTPQEEARLSATRLVDAEAQDAYLKGRYLLDQRTPEASQKSARYFQLATQKDPRYARAQLGLAEAYVVLASDDFADPAALVQKAAEAAQRALALDGELGEAYATLAQVELIYRWDFRRAEQLFRRATELSPNYATAHQWYGLLLMAERRFGEARREFETALGVDPLSLVTGIDIGQVYLYSGQFDQTLEQARRILDLNPNFPMAYDLLGMAYEQEKMYPDALAAFERYAELTRRGVDARMHLAHVYAVSGKRTQARELLRELEGSSRPGEFRSPYDIASIHVGLGENERAFYWLDLAVKERAPMLVYADIDWLLAPLRADARFQELLDRVGLPRSQGK